MNYDDGDKERGVSAAFIPSVADGHHREQRGARPTLAGALRAKGIDQTELEVNEGAPARLDSPCDAGGALPLADQSPRLSLTRQKPTWHRYLSCTERLLAGWNRSGQLRGARDEPIGALVLIHSGHGLRAAQESLDLLQGITLCTTAPHVLDCAWARLGCERPDLDESGAVDDADQAMLEAAFEELGDGAPCGADRCAGADLDSSGALDASDRAFMEAALGCVR